MAVQPKRTRRLRGVRIFIVGLAAALMSVLAPQAAHADQVYVDVLWLRSQHQSESFSDEIRIYVNGVRYGGWNDVDTGETHWYYGSIFPRALIRIPFSGSTFIEVFEEDGNDLGIQGWVPVNESERDTGEHEGVANQAPDDGSYVVRYQVHG